MFVSHLWLFLLIIFLPNVIVIARNATCVDDFVYMNKTKIDNYTTYCKDGNKACIQKCCSGSLTKVVYMYRKKRKIAKECLEIEEIRNITKTNFTIDYSLIQVYENNYGKNKERKSNMSLSETYFKFIWNKKLAPKSCGNTVYPKNMDNYLILEVSTAFYYLHNPRQNSKYPTFTVILLKIILIYENSDVPSKIGLADINKLNHT